MTGLERREIAERLVMLQEDVTYGIPPASEIIDAIHWAEDDLESNGGEEVLKILNDLISDYEDYDEIADIAKELIELING